MNSTDYLTVSPPLLRIPSGIFDLRSFDEQEIAPQTQVAIGNVSPIVNPRGQVATGLHPL